MEITGTILKITDEYLRIQTIKKKQEVDIFFPESKRIGIYARYEPHMITTIEIEIQSIDHSENKIAKLWFVYVISPAERRPDECLNEPARKYREDMKVLYRKTNN